MRMTIRATGLLAAAAVALAMTACAGPSGDGGRASSDTITVGVASIPTTLDPSQNYENDQYAIMQLVAGTLTNLTRDGKQVTMALAESVEPGAQGYVVKMKPGLKFSDGSALTATDVAATFEHYLADKSNGAGYLFAPIKKVTAADALTVNFDLSGPYSSLPTVLSLPMMAILPSAAIKARDQQKLYEGDPLPTAGQFEVKSLSGDETTLQANPNYQGAQPSTRTVVFKKIRDPAARMVQLQAGQLDFANDLSPKQLTQLPAGVTETVSSSPIGAFMLVMNNRDNSVLSDVRIRKALALAVSRTQINDVAFGGQSRPALGLFGSASQFKMDFLPADADVAAAKKLLEGTKCATGCTLKFIGDSTNQKEIDSSIVVQANLKAIGIDVTIQNVDTATAQADALIKGNFDLAIRGSVDVADYPDGFLPYTLGPAIKAYRTGYSSEKMDQLIQEVINTAGPERAAATQRLNALFEEDLPMAPLVDVPTFSASRVPADRFTQVNGCYFVVG